MKSTPFETEHTILRRWDRDAVPHPDQWIETNGLVGPAEAPGIQRLWVRYRHGGYAVRMNREVVWNWQISREKFLGHSDQNDAVAYQFVPILPLMTPAEKRQRFAEKSDMPFTPHDGSDPGIDYPYALHGNQCVDILRRDGRIIAHCRVSLLIWGWEKCRTPEANIVGYRPSPKL